MKTKILKILGVALTLITLASMFVIASPVSAGTQAWSKISLPASGTAGKYALSDFDTLGPIAQAKDGSAIYMGAGYAYDQSLFKSTDFGRTWTEIPALAALPDFGGQIFDIQCSSLDVNTIYVTDGYDIYKTVNGGTSWIVIANLFDSTVVSADGIITSLSIGYLGTSPYIFATTSTFGTVEDGGAYVCQEAVYGSPWSDLNVGTDRAEFTTPWLDCVRITVLPDFATTQGIMLLWTDYYNDYTRVGTKFGGGQWDSVANDIYLPYTDGVNTYDFYTPLLNGNIFIPSDFSSNPNTGLMQAFVSVSTRYQDDGSDVYLCYFGPAAADDSPAFDLNIAGTDTDTNISWMSGIGTSAGASIMVSGYSYDDNMTTPIVYTSKNGGQTWTEASKNPTGYGNNLYYDGYDYPALSVCLLKSDFATSGQALVATQGEGTGYDNGVSFTADSGVTFNTISMVNDDIASISDMSLTSDNTIYVATAGSYDSIWRNVAGVWERVNSESLFPYPAGFVVVEAVPDNSAVFAADGSGYIYRSLDKGQTWRSQLTVNPGGAFTTWFVSSSTSILVADGADIYQTNTNGVVWFTRVVDNTYAMNITDIRKAANGDLLAAGSDGGSIWLARSTDGGLTWTSFDTAIAGTTTAFVSPAADYATSGKVFFTGNSGKIYSGAFASTTTWKQVDKGANGTFTSNLSTGLVTSVGGPGASAEGTGMAYVMGNITDNANLAPLSGTATVKNGAVERIKGSATQAEMIGAPSSTVTGSGLWLGASSVGSVALYTTGSDANIWTYTDTLNVAGAGVAAPTVNDTSATLTFSTLTNATDYLVFVNTTAQTSIYTAANAAGVAVAAEVVSGTTGTVAITGLTPVTTYYVSVWANAPVSSFMFGGTASFTTDPSVPVFPSGLVPAPGAQNVVTNATFQWQPVAGATSYELWLDTKPDFSTAQKFTGIATNAFVTPTALANSTVYYWQVRAVTSSGTSAWNGTWSFTTVAAPTPVVTISQLPQPTLIITQPPAVTITQAAPAPAPVLTVIQPTYTIAPPATTTPSYIWAIVAVGAILTLAVIILIIRTRRVV